MTTIFGREGELGRIRRVLDSAQTNRLVRAIRILGPSGVGKTALATGGADSARDRGWLVAQAQCFRIHSSLPLFLARRLTRSIVEALRDRAETYRSGLDLESDKPDRFEEAFYRLVEAVTLDFPLILMVDDAQWSDEPSRDLLVRTATALADRPIVLLSTERNDEGPEAAFRLEDEAIAVGDLSARAVEQLIRSVYPAANNDVIESIVSSTGARAVDIVAVAEAARDADASTSKAVSISTRTVIARDLAILDASVRTFLQICALIEEPIDFGLLRLMWPQDELLDLIGKTSGRYLIEDEGELRFVHAAIMESVHETIPIEIPLRYRIIEALKALPTQRLEDYERLIQQAAATRDAQLERDTLLKLSQDATSKSFHTLAADAMERALRISPPSPHDLVPFYSQLSVLYNTMGREADCVRVCREALTAAHNAGIEAGLGHIAASLILALWHMGRYASAREEYARYQAAFASPADRAQVISVGSYIEMNAAHFDALHRTTDEFNALGEGVHPFVSLRQLISEAFAAFRTGDEVRGLELTARADNVAQALPPIAMTMPRNVRMMHAIQYLGVAATEQIIPSRQNELSEVLSDVLSATILLARGQFLDLRECVSEKLLHRRGRLASRMLLTSFAVSAAFDPQQASHALWSQVAEEVAEYHAGDRATALLPLTAAWLAVAGERAGSQAGKVLRELIDLHSQPLDNMVFSYPVLLVLAATKLQAKDQLTHLAQPGTLFADKHPLGEAHKLLAQGAALIALGDRSGKAALRASQERFTSLGMTFFAQYASTAATAASDATAAPAPNKTTRREREVAALVADGLTNREIAERLVLSERTVEGHIANLFAKVNVGSRTQLAAWYLRTTNSVASSP